MIPPEYHADEKMSTGILKKRKMKVFRRERAVPSSFLADSRRERKPMYCTTRVPARRGVLKLNSKKGQNRLWERITVAGTDGLTDGKTVRSSAKRKGGAGFFRPVRSGAKRRKKTAEQNASRFLFVRMRPQPADSSSARVSQMLAMSSA